MDKKIIWALVIGLLVGLSVAAISNEALYPTDRTSLNLLGFWGLVYGSFSAAVTFGIVLALSSRIGWFIAALALGLFGMAVLLWIVMWRVPPWTLEGWWMYALAASSGICAVLTGRKTRRSRDQRP